MAKEKNVLVKENWSSNFTLIGTPKISDFTYKIDEQNEGSSWIYNSLNLGVDCGEKHGTVYCELFGGYSDERENKIYAHGKKEDGKDDYSVKMEIAWEDRFDESILEEVGDMCFITVGLEKTDKGKTYYNKFLSAYDAIAYVKEHLTSEMVVNVKGNLKYSTYNDRTQIRKTINSIVLSSKEDPSEFKAVFTQTILLDKDSASKENIDKDKGVMYVNSRVLDYVKEYNGVEVKGNFPFPVQFEFVMDLSEPEQCKKIIDKVFKVKKGITQETFEGEFVESGAVVQTTVDDLPEEFKEYIMLGLYTKEEALAKCSTNGNKERRMILCRPVFKMVGNEEKMPVLQKFEEKFDEEDLVLDCMTKNINDEQIPWEEDESESSDNDDAMSWLDSL